MSNLKKLAILLQLFVLSSSPSLAQLHFETGINFISPTGEFGTSTEFGAGAYIEPKYLLTEHVDIGLHLGLNGVLGKNLKSGATLPTILATYTYRLPTNHMIFYGGLGFGIYVLRGNRLLIESTEFGIAPRLGIYLGRLNLGLTYNVVTEANFIQEEIISANANFLQVNVGVRILSRE